MADKCEEGSGGDACFHSEHDPSGSGAGWEQNVSAERERALEQGEALMTRRGRLIRAASDTGSAQDRAIWQGPMPPRNDRPLKYKPERPCARCGRRFRPTAKRQLLCSGCFRRGDAGMD